MLLCGRIYRLRPSAPRTAATAGSASPSGWPTPRASESENRTTRDAPSHDGNAHGATLAGRAGSWQTPRVSTGAYTRDGGEPGAERPSLEGEAELWQTPRAAEAMCRESMRAPEAVRAEIATHGRGGASTGKLEDQCSLWQTPHTMAGGGKRRGAGRGEEMLLPGQAELWATPSGSDAKGGADWANRQRDGAPRRPSVMRLCDQTEAAVCPSSPPAPEIGTPGAASSNATPGQPPPSAKKRLNPYFVDWLMGLPPGWTSLAPIGSVPGGTRSYLSALRSLCDFYADDYGSC